MRLIDADALKIALRLEYPMIPMFKESRKEWEIKTEGYRKAEEVIKEAPTIDAVSVVRCGECKHMYDGIKGDGYLICHKFNHFVKADDFCSYGEREGE